MIDAGDVVVMVLASYGGENVRPEEYMGKLVATVDDSRGSKTTVQGAYVKGMHAVYVHAFKDSSDVLATFLRRNVACRMRASGWALCECMVECGYKLVDTVQLRP